MCLSTVKLPSFSRLNPPDSLRNSVAGPTPTPIMTTSAGMLFPPFNLMDPTWDERDEDASADSTDAFIWNLIPLSSCIFCNISPTFSPRTRSLQSAIDSKMLIQRNFLHSNDVNIVFLAQRNCNFHTDKSSPDDNNFLLPSTRRIYNLLCLWDSTQFINPFELLESWQWQHLWRSTRRKNK